MESTPFATDLELGRGFHLGPPSLCPPHRLLTSLFLNKPPSALDMILCGRFGRDGCLLMKIGALCFNIRVPLAK